MRAFQFIALTPAGTADPSIAIAASRAGALGVLNLGHTPDVAAARQAIADLARYTDAAATCGLKLDTSASTMLEALTAAADLPEQIGVLILTSRKIENLGYQLPTWHKRDFTVLVEVTNVAQAALAVQAGADGLIAKGHEAGGWVGDESTFILLQHLLTRFNVPIWAYGGIGLHSAAACFMAGAAGVVLDTQLALAQESRLPDAVKTAIAAMDGSETICLGSEFDRSFRIYSRPGSAALRSLIETSLALLESDRPLEERAEVWRQAVEARVGWGSLQQNVWPLDQAATFAKPLADRYRTVGGILTALREALSSHIQSAARLRSLAEDSPLAQAHHTRYPIVQGPMTRVSDRAEFALRVAEGGGLPFLALALMRAPQVEELLQETQQRLGGRSWGVGILGFVPLELRQEQLAIVRKFSPSYALIAGGRPDQARALEHDGIPTYLHVPSPGLLRQFLQDGARRFIFEGRECGGHVGPRSSFVLWNTMVDVLLDELPPDEAGDCCVLFAGGIHDRLSAAMVATLAAPLAERGVRIGVLMGTAYLFTGEIVASGAIVPGFQDAALHCEATTLLESGPGHATRCIPTAFVDTFKQEKIHLQQENKSADEIRRALEELNVGRLRIASKGIAHHPRYEQDAAAPKYITLDEQDQRRQGMYMIGQVAALRDRTCTIAELHHDVSAESARLIETVAAAQTTSVYRMTAQPAEIAIVGMSTLLPKAKNLQEFWANIVNGVSAITEVPRQRWDADLYFDPDRNAADRIYSRAGGFLDDVLFDPLEFGIPPNSLPSIDPLHLLALIAARDALADAGYAVRPFDRARTSVILGASGGTGDLGANYLLRSGLPLLFGPTGFEIAQKANGVLPKWTEDSFAGLLLNVTAGRIANRFDFGGLNYVVDAACASSLAAVHLAVKELETHNTDVVIVGGVDTVQNPFGYLCFSKTQALSPSGQPRVFDATADGIVISEGIVMLVLKRLADAERDGDRIYAVISAVGGSSDGRAMGMTAPRPEGQRLALERAYAKAGCSPVTVELFEAHGTGTVVGDRTEATSLSKFLTDAGAQPQQHAIGSVKSMIGHTKATAGVAGVAKMANALYHKVLPPTLGVTQPNPKAGFGDGPLYVNSETRPWIHGVQDHPRRAGVSAFGFGGTNFHAVLEEYTRDFLAEQHDATLAHWPSELLLWSASSRQQLLNSIETLQQTLHDGTQLALRDLAYTLWRVAHDQSLAGDLRLAVVTNSLPDLQQKLATVSAALRSDSPIRIWDLRGIYLVDNSPLREGQIAFLFPGQGSQYPDMLRDLAIHFPEVRETFEHTDRVLVDRFPQPLSGYIFPPPSFNEEEERARQQALTQTNVAQPALGAADLGAFTLLRALGVLPSLAAGHSYGEYAALCAAGVFDLNSLAVLSEARGRSIIESAGDDLGTMAAVRSDARTVAAALKDAPDVWIANVNAPNQTIISGTKAGIAEAVRRLETQGLSARSIPVACAFHSPLMEPAKQRLAAVLARQSFAAPELAVFSNTTADAYSHEPEAIRELLVDHMVRPVQFADEIEALYQAGARLFVEVGPNTVLTGLVGQTLGDRPHLAIALDQPRRNGLTQLLQALGQLAAHGVSVDLERLFRGRSARQQNLKALAQENSPSPTTWLVNGSRARPLHAPDDEVHDPPFASISLSPNGHTPPQGQLAAPASSAPSLSQLQETDQRSALAQSIQPASPASTNEVEQIMLQFQETMSHFLETQRSVMLTYLQTAGGAAAGMSVQAAVESVSAAMPISDNAAQTVIQQEDTQAATTTPPVTPVALESTTSEPALNKAQLTQQLLQIVSERTGYPPDMLDMEVDIEAALGIDSIKRVEILGILQRECLPPDRRVGSEAMEKLIGLKTLSGIVEWLDAALRAEPASSADTLAVESPAAPVADQKLPEVVADARVAVSRSMWSLVDAPPIHSRSIVLKPDRVLLITDDGRGIADELAKHIRDRDGRAVVIRSSGDATAIDRDVVQTDLSDPAAVSEVVATIRQQYGAIGGVIHLLPLQAGVNWNDLDLAAWRDRLRREVKGLFYLAQAAAADLKRAGEADATWLIAACALSDIDDPMEQPMCFPGHGGIAGLIKTLALEWPSVRCKMVGLDLRSATAALADQLLQEMFADDDLIEVSYSGLRRRMRKPTLVAFDEGAPAHPLIDSSSVVLVTGGARGITAEIACELARRYRPTLVLAGSSALPQAEESPQTGGLTSPKELKSALMEQLRQSGEPIAIAQVEAAYNRLLKEREIRHNLQRLQEAGASIIYLQVDVRDEQAMTDLVAGIYRDYGRLDGVIHGAGIIEDKLIEDKSVESFDRVFDTKADSAFILSQVLRSDTLKFLALFSSVSGLFGNRGQSDYAAANEVLNQLACHLDRQWPGRVVSLNWGPWQKAGMVTPELQREFAKRQVELIPMAEGARIFDEELQRGQKNAPIIILAGGAGRVPDTPQHVVTKPSFPLLQRVTLTGENGSGIAATYTLDPMKDRYLQDHQLDGKPVFPFAMAMELMAEAAQQGWPDLHVTGLSDLQILKGIVVENGSKPVRVSAHAHAEPLHEEAGIHVAVELGEVNANGRPYYRGTIELTDHLPQPPRYQLPRQDELQPFALTVNEAYREWLFHGPLFQGIAAIQGISSDAMIATCVPSSPRRCLTDETDGDWLIDPVVFDSALQMIILWTRMYKDATPLPSRFKRYRRFGPLTGSQVQCHLRIPPDTQDHLFSVDIAFVSADGHLLGLLEGMECPSSKLLNRLATQPLHS